MKSLAVKYRPKTWNDVVEQEAITSILQEQVSSNTQKHSYLFVGPAGCGKTTCARIFANELNQGKGNAIEIDAASNSGVDNVRGIVEDVKRKPIAGEYKIYIVDECHSLSNGAWQAFLKLLEEPPATAVFIICTTDPQKIPATIISRVQRYDFSKMSLAGIKERLEQIISAERDDQISDCGGHPEVDGTLIMDVDDDAVDYIAKMAEGGMRDAITMLDKCLSYRDHVTLPDVLTVLGTASYEAYFGLMTAIFNSDPALATEIVETQYNNGRDLKQFMRNFQFFLLDVAKYKVFNSFELVQIPDVDNYRELMDSEFITDVWKLLKWAQQVNNDVKWDPNPRGIIGTAVMLAAMPKEAE